MVRYAEEALAGIGDAAHSAEASGGAKRLPGQKLCADDEGGEATC